MAQKKLTRRKKVEKLLIQLPTHVALHHRGDVVV